MTRRGPGWRDEAAARLVVRHLGEVGVRGPALVMEDPRAEVARALREREASPVTTWSRRALGGRAASPWPPSGPFALVALRLPRAREELEMLLHAAAGVLDDGGRLLVYGANDEGIRSAPKRMESLFEGVRTVATGGRCRFLAGRGLRADVALRDRLEAWRSEAEPPRPGLADPWISYPGVFAHGRLDEGTRTLLDRLPTVSSGSRVLDFGCGDGVVGASIVARTPTAEVELLDVDAVALEAARANVPRGRTILSDGFGAVTGTRYDLVVSNPPYHAGKRESLDVVERLVRGAPGHLREGGRLLMVVQRRLPVEGPLQQAFRVVEVRGEEGAFRVWAASP